jgi:hypothetical protein
MAIIVPAERRIICHDYEDYSIPLTILQEEFLTSNDEELMQALTQYRPRTKIKAGDFVMLDEIPAWLKNRPILPRCWKVRFVITAYAYHLMQLVEHHGGQLGLDQAISFLEAQPYPAPRDYRKPMVYATGYPHGEYPDSAAWLPEPSLRRTIYKETQMAWFDIVNEAGAEYRGFDSEQFKSRFALDFAPDNYKDGNNLGRPFVAEEPLVNTLHFLGLGEMLEVPHVQGEPDRVRPLDRDHPIFDLKD